MANINEYIILTKGLTKIFNDLNYLIGPNLHEDIQTLRRNIKTLKTNFYYIKSNVRKTSRILKIRKYKRLKKNFEK